MQSITIRKRKTNGSSLIELPICLFILFVLFLFPLIDVATIAIRSTTSFAAAQNAAIRAARTSSFQSARTAAVNAARETAARCPGVSLDPSDVRVWIAAVPFDGGAQIRQQTPLRQIQKDRYLYQIEVEVRSQVQPLVTCNPGLFGVVPGLTAPMSINSVGREICEQPQGLTR